MSTRALAATARLTPSLEQAAAGAVVTQRNRHAQGRAWLGQPQLPSRASKQKTNRQLACHGRSVNKYVKLFTRSSTTRLLDFSLWGVYGGGINLWMIYSVVYGEHCSSIPRGTVLAVSGATHDAAGSNELLERCAVFDCRLRLHWHCCR